MSAIDRTALLAAVDELHKVLWHPEAKDIRDRLRSLLNVEPIEIGASNPENVPLAPIVTALASSRAASALQTAISVSTSLPMTAPSLSRRNGTLASSALCTT